MQQKNNSLGSLGEAAAAQMLVQQGYQIVARNFRVRQGEIDIIAQNDRFLIFVEVKTRTNMHFGRPCEAVTHTKQQHLRIAAQIYLQNHPTSLQPRFDVCEVYWNRQTNQPQQIHFITNAFEG